MRCLNDVEVTWLVDGDADERDRGALIDHVASCDACHALVAESMDSAADEPLRFGRYEMLRAVGGGGMGTVFCAYDPVLRRLVAIKIIADAQHDPAEREQMLGEARALASLRHENVVAIHDVGIVDDELFLAMEFVEGTPLHVAMQGLTDDATRLRVLADLTRGVAALHGRGLIHRDLKPSNVMVTPGGRAIVLDLGLATDLGTERLAAGSPGYVAPEVLAGRGASPASDQYAWWRVVAELFATAALPRRARAALEAAIARGTSQDPALRFASLDEAYAAVEQIVRPRRRRGRILAGVGALTLAVAGTVVVTSMRRASTCAVVEGWDAAARAQVARVVRHHDFDVDRVLQALDQRTTDVGAHLTAVCAAAPSIERDRERLCVGLVWRENLRSIRKIARDGTRAEVAEALDGLARALPVSRCSDRNPPAQMPPPTAAQRADFETLQDQIDAAAQHQGQRSIEQLDALRPAIERNGYAGLSIAWSSALISELMFAGDLARARRELDRARYLAQVSGDDVQLGWFAMTQLRLAIGTGTATDEMEADVDAIQKRVGSPLLSAEALQVRAHRAYTRAEPQRAVDHVTAALALYAQVSVISPPGLRTAYLMRAAALQQLGKLDEAQADLERAYAVATERYAPGSAEVEETAAARANNLAYRGKLDEARTAFRALRAEMAAAGRDRTTTAVRIDLSLCQVETLQRTAARGAACEAAVASAQALHGVDSTQTIAARNALAQHLLETSPAKAIDVLEQTLRIGARGGAGPMDIPYAEALLGLAYDEAKRHADGCPIAQRALAALRTSAQVGMVKALETAFPELRANGRCARP